MIILSGLDNRIRLPLNSAGQPHNSSRLPRFPKKREPSTMFNAKGGDGVAAELPQGWRPRPTLKDAVKPAGKQTFYHDKVRFQLPDGSPVEVSVVITTRRQWETRKLDKTGWAVIPFLKYWVVVLQLTV
jgi:hypothetical protein